MKRYVTETTIAAVREVEPIEAGRKAQDGTVTFTKAPKEWQITTTPPGPLCFVVQHDPKIKAGQRACVVLEIDDREPDAGDR